MIEDITGRWLDEQVAMIAAIAFNADVSSDAVRKLAQNEGSRRNYRPIRFPSHRSCP